MTSAPSLTAALGHRFADQLPELAVPWQAADAPQPQLLLLNEPLAGELGLDPVFLRSDAGLGLLTGTVVPDGAAPVAQAYSGHQFGYYSPRLGDGRALLLGELQDRTGTLRDLALKGSGRTPFARGGDGYAALGPMLREYIVSESMHALGIPTTRSLAVVATGRPVQREGLLPGAVLARVASSHLRVGTFQYATSTGNLDLLRRLTDAAIAWHHPGAADADNSALALLEAVTDAQADLIARWMLVGFVHGVMNTDNMTISGETIDYGPCAFLDGFDPTAVYSSIDEQGRYAYRNQPGIGQWNLTRLAEALLPLLADDTDEAVRLATAVLETFPGAYSDAWVAGGRRKLGLASDVGDDVVGPLLQEAYALLQTTDADATAFFRRLSSAARGDSAPARRLFRDTAAFDQWAARWLALGPDADAMDRVNPVYIPRNHLVEEALAAAGDGDLEPVTRLLEAVTAPFDERDGFERYAERAPEDFGLYTTYCGT
ncbi:MAG TPA: YdiU family protein [Naasia sp.]|jgi:uncharacterized protein YdiU (UPF0061 family)